MKRSWSRAVAFALLAGGAGGASAQAGSVGDGRATYAAASGPEILVANCPEDLATGLRPSVRLEIDVLLREQSPPAPAPELVSIRCEGGLVVIAVTMAGARRETTAAVGALAAEHRAR